MDVIHIKVAGSIGAKELEIIELAGAAPGTQVLITQHKRSIDIQIIGSVVPVDHIRNFVPLIGAVRTGVHRSAATCDVMAPDLPALHPHRGAGVRGSRRIRRIEVRTAKCVQRILVTGRRIPPDTCVNGDDAR